MGWGTTQMESSFYMYALAGILKKAHAQIITNCCSFPDYDQIPLGRFQDSGTPEA